MAKIYRILLAFLVVGIISFDTSAQQYWTAHNESDLVLNKDKAVARLSFPKEFKLFDLNIEPLRQQLFTVTSPNPQRHSTVITLPTADGSLEQFEVFEASNFEPDLQARFPEIRAFSGKGITNPGSRLKLSIAPNGIQTMVFRVGKENEFIEPYSQDHTVYAAFKSRRDKGRLPWTFTTEEKKMAANIDHQV